jgi:adenylyltransferase/sulfurtransferase
MPTYRELLAQVKQEIAEIDANALAGELASATPPVLIDVREPDEYEQGAIAESIHIPRGFLESRIEATAPDHDQRIVLSCASGARSAFGAKVLAGGQRLDRRRGRLGGAQGVGVGHHGEQRR